MYLKARSHPRRRRRVAPRLNLEASSLWRLEGLWHLYKSVQTLGTQQQMIVQGPSVNMGTDLISTSSTVVSGHGKFFKSQLRVGDAILTYTQKGDKEMRVVTMVLSDVSASISFTFSSSIATPTPFKCISEPRDDKRDKATKMAKAKQE